MSGARQPLKASRAPIFNIPGVVAILGIGLVLAHVARVALPDDANFSVLRELAYVPGRWGAYFAPHAFLEHLTQRSEGLGSRLQLAQAFVLHGGLKPWTLLSYSVLHGSLAHLALNLVWFVAFGAPVARRFGAVRFTLFLAVAAAASALAQTIVDPFGVEPVIGASGAVSGVTAAALRFVFQPGGSLVAAPAQTPAPPSKKVDAIPLLAIWRDRQVVGFVAAWFVLNLLFGVFAQALGLSDQPIAWQAHIGGFLAGLVMFDAFEPPAVGGQPQEASGAGVVTEEK